VKSNPPFPLARFESNLRRLETNARHPSLHATLEELFLVWVANAVGTVWKGTTAASHTSKRASVLRKRQPILFTSTSMPHAGVRPFAPKRRQRRQRPSPAVSQTTEMAARNATAALTATGATAASLWRPVLPAATSGVQTCAAAATPASRPTAMHNSVQLF